MLPYFPLFYKNGWCRDIAIVFRSNFMISSKSFSTCKCLEDPEMLPQNQYFLKKHIVGRRLTDVRVTAKLCFAREVIRWESHSKRSFDDTRTSINRRSTGSSFNTSKTWVNFKTYPLLKGLDITL